MTLPKSMPSAPQQTIERGKTKRQSFMIGVTQSGLVIAYNFFCAIHFFEISIQSPPEKNWEVTKFHCSLSWSLKPNWGWAKKKQSINLLSSEKKAHFRFQMDGNRNKSSSEWITLEKNFDIKSMLHRDSSPLCARKKTKQREKIYWLAGLGTMPLRETNTKDIAKETSNMSFDTYLRGSQFGASYYSFQPVASFFFDLWMSLNVFVTHCTNFFSVVSCRWNANVHNKQKIFPLSRARDICDCRYGFPATRKSPGIKSFIADKSTAARCDLFTCIHLTRHLQLNGFFHFASVKLAFRLFFFDFFFISEL